MLKQLNTLTRESAYRLARFVRRQFQQEILVVGDSHAAVFNSKVLLWAFPGVFFNVVSVGGAAASAINNPNSKTQAYRIFKDEIANFHGKKVVVMLGEVDTGFVIRYRAKKYGANVADMLVRTVEVYMGFIQGLSERYEVIVVSTALPTIPDGASLGEVVIARKEITASQKARTDLTLAFSSCKQPLPPARLAPCQCGY